MYTEKSYYKNSMSNTEDLWHSQNFLYDSRFVKSLVSMTDINKEDCVVEIGPGRGIITEELSQQAGQVIGIEIDKSLAVSLKKKFYSSENIEIIEADFLKWKNPKYPYKVFSNIPFEYTSRIIDKLLLSSNPPQNTYLIMQDLAAQRYIGQPFTQNSQISILLQPFYDMDILTHIDRKQYKPIPNVNTVLAQFEKRKNPLIKFDLINTYRDFVIYGFNQWKPTILESFNKVFSYKQQKIIERNLHIKGKKPSEISLKEWIFLFQTYLQYVPEEKKKFVYGAERFLKQQQKDIEKTYRTRKGKK